MYTKQLHLHFLGRGNVNDQLACLSLHRGRPGFTMSLATSRVGVSRSTERRERRNRRVGDKWLRKLEKKAVTLRTHTQTLSVCWRQPDGPCWDQSRVPSNDGIENRFEIMSPSGMALLGSRKQSLVAKARGYILRSCYVHAEDRHFHCGL